MRGKHGFNLRRRTACRITPAYAGKTGMEGIDRKILTDHPRVCGENREQHDRRHGAGGSPPRMRGKLPEAGIKVINIRITPAYAGKTQVILPSSVRKRDHPRVCGENSEDGAAPRIVPGSPPRMRGKLCAGNRTGQKDGITPAYAGKTSFFILHDALAQDHPRVCGENSGFFTLHRCALGSPPRMRGKRTSSTTTATVQEDHPRVCGENLPLRACPRRCLGSPPRMRGKPWIAF